MAVCVCWKWERRFLRSWKVFSVMCKIPCSDTNKTYMLYCNKVHVLGSECYLKLNILAFIHSVNLIKMEVCAKNSTLWCVDPGWMLGAHQSCLTPSSLAGHERKSRTKVLWVGIRASRVHSLSTILSKMYSAWEISVFYNQANQGRIMRNKLKSLKPLHPPFPSSLTQLYF